MSLAEPTVAEQVSSSSLEALAFRAPYVIERLVKDRIADTVSEAEQLFSEVKKYLILTDVNRDAVLGMYSARVDEAWHAFILYTAEYADFCMRFFGRHIGHVPKNAPPDDTKDQEHCAELTFDAFEARYQALFKEPLPYVWYDVRSVIAARRVFNDLPSSATVVQHNSVAELLDETGDVILSANDIVYDALAFIARTGAFYVRELPGTLTEDEKVALVKALMSVGVLRIAP
jgi:hypothetical protein